MASIIQPYQKQKKSFLEDLQSIASAAKSVSGSYGDYRKTLDPQNQTSSAPSPQAAPGYGPDAGMPMQDTPDSNFYMSPAMSSAMPPDDRSDWSNTPMGRKMMRGY